MTSVRIRISVIGCGQVADGLVGEGSDDESHAHCRCTLGGPVGGVGRLDPASAQALKLAG